MTKAISTLVLSALISPLAFAASKSDGPKDEAVGFGALLYGFTDVTTWVAFGTLVVFLLIAWYFGAFKVIANALDGRAKAIEDQLAEAKTLREEAAKVMAEAEAKAKEAEAAADEIVKRAKADAKTLMKKAKEDLASKVARREAQAEQRIARAEEEATSDVRKAAADAATKAARQILSGSENTSDLFDRALTEIDDRLN